MIRLIKKIFKKLKTNNNHTNTIPDITINGINNEYDVPFLNNNNLKLVINGSNNKIVIPDNITFTHIHIEVYGNNNKIILKDNIQLNGPFSATLGYPQHNKASDCALIIGDGTIINGISFVLLEPKTQIIIGSDCIISDGIEIWGSDTHSIIDLNGALLNYGDKVEIGNHVWIGRNVKIGKRAKIPNNSVIGWNSVVMSKFDKENTIIAGNPAKIVKENINWDMLSPKNYLMERSITQ